MTLYDLLKGRRTLPATGTSGAALGSNVRSMVPSGSPTNPTLGGSVPARMMPPQTHPGANPSHGIGNPASPAPITPTFGNVASGTMGTWWSALALAATTTAGQPCPLKNLGDITTLRQDISETLTGTGTVTTGTLFGSVWDHFVIQAPEGDTLVNTPGGAMLELLGMWGSYPPGNLINNTGLAAQTTIQTAAVTLPGLRFPQKQNSYNLIPTFNTIVGSGSANATANTVSVNLGIDYATPGSLGGVETHFITQTYTVNASGYTDLGVTSVAKNQIIQGMFITGSTTAKIDEFYVETNGGVIEGLSAGSAGDYLVNRQALRFAGGSSIPAGDIIYVPPSTWASNDGSYVRVHSTDTSAETWTVGWLWHQIPKGG